VCCMRKRTGLARRHQRQFGFATQTPVRRAKVGFEASVLCIWCHLPVRAQANPGGWHRANRTLATVSLICKSVLRGKGYNENC
jgi:hypothetical protein